jgi:hypothetical protein
MNDIMQQCVRRNENVSWRDFDSECILLHLDSGCYYTLNGVGKFIWQHLNPGVKLAAVHVAMQDHFEVDAEPAESDLCELVEQLLEDDLVVVDVRPAT